MPDLVIRNMPQQLYEKLKRRAERDHRSVPAESIHLLQHTLEQEERREQHRKAMESIIERAKGKGSLSVDSLTLLREDRDA